MKNTTSTPSHSSRGWKVGLSFSLAVGRLGSLSLPLCLRLSVSLSLSLIHSRSLALSLSLSFSLSSSLWTAPQLQLPKQESRSLSLSLFLPLSLSPPLSLTLHRWVQGLGFGVKPRTVHSFRDKVWGSRVCCQTLLQARSWSCELFRLAWPHKYAYMIFLQ